MTSTYCENASAVLQKLEHAIPSAVSDEQQIMYSDDKNDLKLLLYFCTTSSNDQTHETSFDLKEWIIYDSHLGRSRLPRQNEFLLLLLAKEHYSSYISWLDKDQGLCQIHRSQQVAALWSKVKKRRTTGLMDYDTFARGIRSYYKSKLMVKTHKKHVLRFRLPLDIVL